MSGPRERRPRWGKDAEKYLLAGEPPVIATRRHPAVLFLPAVRGLPVLLVGGWLLQLDPDNRVSSTVGLLVVLGALGYLGLYVGEWWVRHFLITRRRVLLTSGVIIRTVAVMPLRRITDLTWKETFFGQILGYGTFRFESAGQKQGLDEITFLPHAAALYKRVSELMFGSDSSTTPVSDDEDGSGSMDDGESAAEDPRNGAPLRTGRRDTAPIPRLRPAAERDD
ncbi:PH domain-containing protein [Modestobacter sp. DSM 44400]|uniref:PH domain-containing protein n=1 Tax=Modestobacter sp. DSM 44400 TaxID=1550230 RepID=UPI000894570E|nr:PH domain-containing protein [Modestobacter sp. DSM 44400]SDX48434.1 PH domain-containing protein [Modestobacter sp. DSM 44400]